MKKKSSFVDISERKLLLRIADVSIIYLIVFLSSDFFEFYLNSKTDFYFNRILLLLLYFLLVGEIFQFYNLKLSLSRFQVVRNLFLTSFITSFIFILTPYYSPPLPQNRIQIFLLFSYLFIPVLIWRFFYIKFLSSSYSKKNIIVIAHSSQISELLELVKNQHYLNLKLYLSDKQNYHYKNFQKIEKVNLYELVSSNDIKEVIINKKGFDENLISKINESIFLLLKKGTVIKSSKNFYEELNQRVSKDYLDYNFYDYFGLSQSQEKRIYNLFRRFFDFIISVIGLLFLIVFIPFIYILNKFFNKGSLFFIQKRIGLNGKDFKIYKFRSMIAVSQTDKTLNTIENDSRTTKFGKFLRKSRLDEMPQFLNILIGDMSIIGPRPERPIFVKQFQKQIPLYSVRHLIKPGLTGWAQVKYFYAQTIDQQEKKLRYDLYYIKEQNLFLDFKILVRTLTTVIFLRGQ